MKNDALQPTLTAMIVIMWFSFLNPVYGQVVDTGDKVGIGINPPLEKLHVNGSIRGNVAGGAIRINTSYGYVDIGPMNPSWSHFQTDMPKFYFNKPLTVNGGLSSYNSNDLYLQTMDVTRVTILNSNGKVGIGTGNPEGKLHVKGVAYFGNENENSSHRVAIGGSGGNYGSIGYGYKYTGTSNEHTYAVADYASQLSFDIGGFTFKTAPSGTTGAPVSFTNAMKILQNGNVGIGTNTIDYKLTVNGKIKAEEMAVVVDVPADYVFNDNYTLISLQEVEQFINDNNHLPGMPSAAEIKETGWEVGVMSNKMLEKIEELTLHMIELKKENDRLNRKNEELEKQIAEIKKQLKK